MRPEPARGPVARRDATATRRLTVLTPYAVAPARHGPQIRVAGVLGHLRAHWTVTHFSQSLQRTDLPWPPKHVRGGPRWVETRMRDPVSLAWLLGASKVLGSGPAYADRLLALAPRREIRRALTAADAVLVSPHYQFAWARRHAPAGTPVVVDCHMIEAEVWSSSGGRLARRLAREIRRSELDAWRRADCVFATREEEAEQIRSSGARRVVVVPNAADVDRLRPVDPRERARLRHALGLPADATLAVFVGSAGFANIAAADLIAQQVSGLREAGVEVVVVGRVGIGRPDVPGCRWVGEVTEVAPWLQAADLALCPLGYGSGTSLKVVEYLAAGLPLVTTPVGARGLSLTDGEQALIVAADAFPAAVARLAADPALRARLGTEARAHAVARFSWSAAGATATAALDTLLGGDQRIGASASSS